RAKHRRDRRQASNDRGSEASLAGDDLIPLRFVCGRLDRPKQDWLCYALGPHARGELVEFRLAEPFPIGLRDPDVD
ncbi:hypothetical protein LTR94_036978, partial [Friedmanniomyces endolithicus]